MNNKTSSTILAILFSAYLLFAQNNKVYSQHKAVLYKALCEEITLNPICKNQLDSIYYLLNQSNGHPFDWTDTKNNCEDRANAVSLILSKWGIANAKAWVFNGKQTRYSKTGLLKGWGYHVGCCVLVKINNANDTIIIDPLTSRSALTIQQWADTISKSSTNLYFITESNKYQQDSISLNPTWKICDTAIIKRTIEGLTRYNDFSLWQRFITKHYLTKRIEYVTREFNFLLANKPAYLTEQCK